MTASKTAIRTEVRTARARRRETADSVRSTLDGPDESTGLVSSWREALLLTGCEPESPDFLPALFVPEPREPDVSAIISSVRRALLPVLVTPEGDVLNEPTWALWEGEDASGPFVQPSPRWPAQPSGKVLGPGALEQASVILVAALAVDLAGSRVGQGAGWYDRALCHAAPDSPVIAAVFDEEVLGSGTLPHEDHDHAVDAIITPSRALLVGQETLTEADID